MRKVNVIERILRHLPEGLTDEDCWITTYAPSGRGYVNIHLDGRCDTQENMSRRLHRVTWEAHNAEPIPEGMVIMHTCDNPLCCNPHHLVVGTHQDNVRDMHAKGRANVGHPTYDHKRMFELRQQGLTYKEIASELGCHPVTVGYALRNFVCED